MDVAVKYDVVIVGAGPAGIFAALELAKAPNLSVLLLEKGPDLERRVCLGRERGVMCPPCSPCAQVSGWGGAGAFSDGKLTLSTEVGGHLVEYVGKRAAEELVSYVDGLYLRFGADNKVYGEGEEVEEWQRRATQAQLRLVPVRVRHVGTERCAQILAEMRRHIAERVEIRTKTAVSRLLTENGRISGVELATGQIVGCDYLVVAPGREGAEWLLAEARRLGLDQTVNPVDVGIRVEVPAVTMEGLTNALYESKLEYYSKSFDDRVRTFCMCPHGEVTTECTAGPDPVVSVNGHSYSESKTDNTNFALLVSTTFTEPFHEPIAYGRYIARLANILSGGVIVQRLGDLLNGRRSTRDRIARGIVHPTLATAVPGDLSCVLPYRHLKDLLEMLDALNRFVPGIASRDTLLYGVEVKFYSSRLRVTPNLETQIGNLFAAGDGAGLSRGLVQASASGILAAREIIRRATGHATERADFDG